MKCFPWQSQLTENLLPLKGVLAINKKLISIPFMQLDQVNWHNGKARYACMMAKADHNNITNPVLTMET